MRARRVIATVGVVGIAGALAFGGIAAAGDDDFDARMDGASEVPGPGDPDGKGEAEIEIDVDAGEVCFEFEWEDIATPTAGHIHAGAAGVAGPIVVDLLGGASPDALESDDEYEACVPGDAEVLEAIVANPDQYYANLHNPRFPAGAVRGQLSD